MQYINGTYTGSTSSAAPPSAPPAPSTTADSNGQCPSGTVNGGTDSAGIPICIGNSPSQKAPSSSSGTTSTQTNANGSTTKTQVTNAQNKDGSTTTTTTTTTTASDGTVTTSSSSTTGKNSLGQDGVSDDANKNDLCTLHPELNVCRNSSVSGTCENVSCTGDAIQCSIMRQVAADACKRKTDEDAVKASPEYSLGDAVLNGNDPDQSTLPTSSNGQTIAMPSSLDSSGWLGGGACFPDKHFSLQGHTFTISFTEACQPLLAFRYVMFVISLLASLRVVGGVMVNPKG